MARISVGTAPPVHRIISLQTLNGNSKLPASVTIPASALAASFDYSGLRAGVEEITASPRRFPLQDGLRAPSRSAARRK